jgi:hypothetical protein
VGGGKRDQLSSIRKKGLSVIPVKLCFVFDDFCCWEREHDLGAGRVEADVHHFLTFVL